MEKNITEHLYKTCVKQRQKLNGHNSFLIFFTGLSGSGKSTIANALEDMKLHLWEQNIIFRDLNPSNILLQKNSETDFYLKVIDGVGHNDFIPICHFAYFGRKKIERMWNRRLKKWFGKYKNVFPLLIPYR